MTSHSGGIHGTAVTTSSIFRVHSNWFRQNTGELKSLCHVSPQINDPLTTPFVI